MAELTGKNIKRIRKKNGFSQERLASLLGVSWITISRWERGVNKPLPKKIAGLERLAQLISIIGESIPKKEIFSFLTTPNRSLDGYRPIDLLKDDYSFRGLLDFVKAAKSGDMT